MLHGFRHKPANQVSETRAGSLLIDLLLAVAIFAIVVTAFSSSLSISERGTRVSSLRTRALYLANEGLEVIKTIRDREGFTNILVGSKQYIYPGTNGWEIGQYVTPDSPDVIDTTFKRTVVVTNVAGTSFTKEIEAKIVWNNIGSDDEEVVALTTQITKWKDDPPPDWSTPSVVAFFLSSSESDFTDVVVDGNYAYLTGQDGGDGFYVIDISTILDPQLADTALIIDTGWGISGVAKKDDYAYVAGYGTKELITIDVSSIDPSTMGDLPTVVQDIAGIGVAKGIYISGNDMWLVREIDASVSPTISEYLQFDLSTTPANPSLSESEDFDFSIYSAYKHNGHLYCGTQKSDKTIELASIETATKALGGSNLNGVVRGISTVALNNTVYLGTIDNTVADTATEELYSFDLSSDPLNPGAAADSYDTISGISNGENGSINDMAVAADPPILFLATDAYAEELVSPYAATHRDFLQIIDIASAPDLGNRIDSLNLLTYMPYAFDGAKGIFYRESDHTIFLVGGPHMIIIRP